jgi:hypothetical protein
MPVTPTSPPPSIPQVRCEGIGRHTVMGTTIDDSMGEAFDKTARLLGISAVPGDRMWWLGGGGGGGGARGGGGGAIASLGVCACLFLVFTVPPSYSVNAHVSLHSVALLLLPLIQLLLVFLVRWCPPGASGSQGQL